MARGVNKVMLIGNLGKEPETRYTQGGAPVTNFSIATSESWTDKQSGQKQERTEWHNISCFGKLAEITGQYLHKGSKVYIEGSIRTNSWEKDGQKHYKTEIIANNMQMLDSRESSSPQNQPQNQPQQQSQQQNGGNYNQNSQTDAMAGLEDDIPF